MKVEIGICSYVTHPEDLKRKTTERYVRSEAMRQQKKWSYTALDTAQGTGRDTPHPELNHWDTPVVSNHYAKSPI